MKGRGLFRALQVASRALSAQKPLLLSNQALYQPNYTSPRVARSGCPSFLFHPRASLSTAAGARAPTDKDTESSTASEFIGLPATTKAHKPRIVVLGTGWAACRLLKDLDTRIYDIICISPRNHMVFTPLLASTCVGTLEFRSVAEPVRLIQPALAKAPNSFYFLAQCRHRHRKPRGLL